VPCICIKVCEGETPSVWPSRIHIEKLWQHSDENKIKWEQQPWLLLYSTLYADLTRIISVDTDLVYWQ
jgi:hypothetical protein